MLRKTSPLHWSDCDKLMGPKRSDKNCIRVFAFHRLVQVYGFAARNIKGKVQATGQFFGNFPEPLMHQKAYYSILTTPQVFGRRSYQKNGKIHSGTVQ